MVFYTVVLHGRNSSSRRTWKLVIDRLLLLNTTVLSSIPFSAEVKGTASVIKPVSEHRAFVLPEMLPPNGKGKGGGFPWHSVLNNKKK